MVNGLLIIAGVIGLGGLYILFDDFFGGKHRAVVWNKGTVKIVKASKSKDGKNYIIKFLGVKHVVPTIDNEYISGKKMFTTWELVNSVLMPISKKDLKFSLPDTSQQIMMVQALEGTVKKIDASFWERNKELIVGSIAIIAGAAIYIVSVKMAGDISPQNLNACLQIAADIRNSSITTENNINTLIDILSDSRIPE